MKSFFPRSFPRRDLRALLCGAILGAAVAPAGAQVTLTATDSSSTGSSFNAGTNWSDGTAPGAGKSYTVSGTNIQLRTPGTTGDFAFQGDSLTLASNGILAFKGTAAGSTITVAQLNLTGGGEVSNFTGVSFVLAGNIVLGNSSNGRALLNTSTNSVGFTIASNISGGGQFQALANGTTAATVAVKLAGTNSYTGGTLVGAFSSLEVGAGSSLGTGNVAVGVSTGANQGGGQLKLDSGQSIADNASLTFVLASAGGLNLNFTGTETIGSLSINGTSVAAGTYGAADFGGILGGVSGLITGTGFLLVAAPEPSPALLGLSALVLGMAARVVRHRAVRA